MLEADEVDADFFTPSSTTSLASIFKKNAVIVEEEKDNPSLKYIPQLPPTDASKSEESKPTQCVLACALQAYEWLHNTYIARGKLGFAIIKVIKSGVHNIVLYDSKKTTVSNATISGSFAIDVKENVSISYYDNVRKYWSIYATQIELNKILEILQSLNVNIKQSSEPKITEKYISINNSEETTTDKEDESNTDSAINKRTKDSILKRMANMGQSVLPNYTVVKNSSDSSDSNMICDKKKSNKHKHLKTISSRNNPERTVSKTESDFGVEVNLIQQRNMYDNNTSDNTHQMVPYTNTAVVKDISSDVKNVGNISDLSLLVAEQRVSNSEIRINLGKITDKLDLVLDTFRDGTKTGHSPSSSNFQDVLVQKLLNEYEMKIKKYEDFIKEKGFNCNNLLDDRIDHKDNLLKEKEDEITKLKKKIATLEDQCKTNVEKENEYKKELTQLKEDMALKNNQLILLNKKLDNTSDHFEKSDDAKNKIKNIMNDTFQSISANFNDEEHYSGSKVKNIVAVVIKKTTIEAINDI